MKELNELVDRYDVRCHCGAVDVRTKQDGHLVMYSDYASLAQRAEAAEAALAEEKRINSKLRQDRAGLARECNAFEAKLAEYEKQEPAAYTNSDGIDALSKGFMVTVFPDKRQVKPVPLFTSPAPAINLAELLPDLEKWRSVDQVRAQAAYRQLILRNIEEQSQ